MEAKKQIKRGVEVLEVYPKILDQYWNLCEFMLREGLKYDGDPMSIKELKEYIKNNAWRKQRQKAPTGQPASRSTSRAGRPPTSTFAYSSGSGQCSRNCCKQRKYGW